MISVITVSIRPERLEIVKKCLDRQIGVEFEWIVEDFVDTSKTWSFNTATNKAIKKAQGELLVFVQDSIWFNPDALHKFWQHYKNNSKGCVSGVGDQYDKLDEYGKPIHKVWLDPRKRLDLGTFYECNPEDWEINFASLPKVLVEEIGGFDEEMDKYYGMDNVAVAYRLDQIGAKFYLDQTNESFSYQHPRKADWDKNHWLAHDFWNWVKKRPVKLDYLRRN